MTLDDLSRRSLWRNAQLSSPARPFARCQQRTRVLNRAGAQIAFDDCIHKAQRLRFGGIDRPRRQNHLERLIEANEPGHALCSAGAGNDPERDFRHAESCARRGNSIVTGQRDFQATTHDGAVHRHDHRHIQRLIAIEQRAVLLFLGRAAELGEE